jgi:hypothetical protein
MALKDRFQKAWNAFFNRDRTEDYAYQDLGIQTYIRPDRPRFSGGNERTIITAIFNRIALDAATANINHVRTDDEDKFLEIIHSGLNDCFNLESNIDQTGRAFVQDIVMSMMDEGVVALVPVDTIGNPLLTTSYDIETMRTGKIIGWFPRHVKINIYNDRSGKREDIILPKSMVGIVENPLYAVINEPNSTMQRLIRKLSLLDYIDDQNGSNKLNMIIQLPYTVKTDIRQKQAENRRKALEEQLVGSKYGIAYIDATEKITQVNRPLENNLMGQIEYLTSMLYSQLGMNEDILKGTADEKVMANYYARTIEPILSAITDEVKRKFLTKTARTQHQSIMFFRDPFRLVPVTDIASIADSFTRNEILTSNEFRQIIGRKPSADPNADQLRNKNLYPEEQGVAYDEAGQPIEEPVDDTAEEDEDIDFSNIPISQLLGQ